MDLPTGKTILSGIQPSGTLHIGNYLGALKQWVALQESNDAYYCIVDLHAITVPYDTSELQNNILNATAIYIAAGIDPEKSTLFVQSHIPAHSELMWLLGTITKKSQLERMTQFKEKKEKREQQDLTEHDFTELEKLLRAKGNSQELKELRNQTAHGFAQFLVKDLENSAAVFPAYLALSKDSTEKTEILRNIIQSMISDQDKVSLGLFAYPILMAADILLYQSDLVPVGADQTQHLEHTRHLAQIFNTKFGDAFKVPDMFHAKVAGRIMSLTEPDNKMSKSDNSKSYIALTDEPDTIRKKIMSAATDTDPVFSFEQSGPAVQNLLRIYQAFSEETPVDIEKKFDGQGYKEFKEALADLVIEKLTPIREKYTELRQDEDHLKDILEQGRTKATEVANKTLEDVKKRMGLL